MAKEAGVKINTNCMAKGADISEEGVTMKWSDKQGEEHTLLVDSVLVTVGRKPNTQGWGLEEMGLRMNDSGRFIAIDEQCRTNMPGVYAIGDVT